MSTLDEQIGKNLTMLRGDMTQAELAGKMRSLGYKWSQATVWAIEKGERTLKLTEAIDLANIFQTLLDSFTARDHTIKISQLARKAFESQNQLIEAIQTHIRSVQELAVTAELLKEHIPDGSLPDEQVMSWLQPLSEITKLAEVEYRDDQQRDTRIMQMLDPDENMDNVEILKGKYIDAFYKAHPLLLDSEK